MTRLEWKRIQERTGAVRQYDDNGTCVFLKNGKCSVYDIRPSVCVLFGNSESKHLTCPHGCKPSKLLTSTETDAITESVRAHGHGHVLNNRPFLAFVKDANLA